MGWRTVLTKIYCWIMISKFRKRNRFQKTLTNLNTVSLHIINNLITAMKPNSRRLEISTKSRNSSNLSRTSSNSIFLISILSPVQKNKKHQRVLCQKNSDNDYKPRFWAINQAHFNQTAFTSKPTSNIISISRISRTPILQEKNPFFMRATTKLPQTNNLWDILLLWMNNSASISLKAILTSSVRTA